jgi:hypothetical protein
VQLRHRLLVQQVLREPLRQAQELRQVSQLLAWGQEWALRMQRGLQQQVRELPWQEPLQQVLQLLQQEQASCLLLQERYAACALREAQLLTMVP